MQLTHEKTYLYYRDLHLQLEVARMLAEQTRTSGAVPTRAHLSGSSKTWFRATVRSMALAAAEVAFHDDRSGLSVISASTQIKVSPVSLDLPSRVPLTWFRLLEKKRKPTRAAAPGLRKVRDPSASSEEGGKGWRDWKSRERGIDGCRRKAEREREREREKERREDRG